jgi:hypothetical protein
MKSDVYWYEFIVMRKLEKIRIGLHCIGPVKLLMSDLRQPQPYFAGNLEQSARQCAPQSAAIFLLDEIAISCCAVLCSGNQEKAKYKVQSESSFSLGAISLLFFCCCNIMI